MKMCIVKKYTIFPQKLSLTILRIEKYAQLFFMSYDLILETYINVNKLSNKRNELFEYFTVTDVDLQDEVEVS